MNPNFKKVIKLFNKRKKKYCFPKNSLAHTIEFVQFISQLRVLQMKKLNKNKRKKMGAQRINTQIELNH